MTSDRIALIDLDGTVADYDKSMIRYMNSIRHPDELPYEGRLLVKGKEIEPAYIEARRKMIQRMPGFWRNLDKLRMGFEVVSVLKGIGFNLHVLTKGPTSSPNAWSEKVEWCAEHLPEASVTISDDKSLVYGRILVDDWPPYFNAWLEKRPRGLVICVEHPWNKDIKHPNVIIYNDCNLYEVRQRAKEAYERE